LPDIHIVKLGCVAGLNLDLLSHFSAGEDSMALKCTEYRIDAALFDLVPAGQALDHLPVGMGIFEVQVERGRINDAGSGESSFSAPQFPAALVVRVQNPHGYPPQGPGWSQLVPRLSCFKGRDKDEVEVWGECDCH
jgi:hypothetical protein